MNTRPTRSPRDWRQCTIAISGMNNRPDNPGPGYAVARCLREAPGFAGRIIGMGYDAFDGGLFHAGICDAAYLLPYPSAGEDSLRERLLQIIDDENVDVIIPCLDAELPSFSHMQNMLRKQGVQLMLPDSNTLQLRNKDRLPALCRQAGISTPHTQSITRIDFFDHCQQQGWSYPLVVKGPFYDAKVAHNAQEARSAFQQLAAQWGVPILVQHYLEGEEFNVAAVGDGKGGSNGLVMMRKRALTEKGKAWAGITIECSELEQQARKLIQHLNWPGPLEVEMLRDYNGQFHLIEINPRFPAWIYLSAGAGCNLPLLLLKQLCGEHTTATHARPGTLFIRYAEELIIDIKRMESMIVDGSLQHIFNDIAA